MYQFFCCHYSERILENRHKAYKKNVYSMRKHDDFIEKQQFNKII
jgi:hypothetical protein